MALVFLDYANRKTATLVLYPSVPTTSLFSKDFNLFILRYQWHLMDLLSRERHTERVPDLMPSVLRVKFRKHEQEGFAVPQRELTAAEL